MRLPLFPSPKGCVSMSILKCFPNALAAAALMLALCSPAMASESPQRLAPDVRAAIEAEVAD